MKGDTELTVKLRLDHAEFTDQLTRLEGRLERVGIYQEITTERMRQDAKWGEQNHRPERWLAILSEEFGEAAKETLYLATMPLNDEEYQLAAQRYRTEVIQIAAVAVAMLESFDRNYRRPVTERAE